MKDFPSLKFTINGGINTLQEAKNQLGHGVHGVSGSTSSILTDVSSLLNDHHTHIYSSNIHHVNSLLTGISAHSFTHLLNYLLSHTLLLSGSFVHLTLTHPPTPSLPNPHPLTHSPTLSSQVMIGRACVNSPFHFRHTDSYLYDRPHDPNHNRRHILTEYAAYALGR